MKKNLRKGISHLMTALLLSGALAGCGASDSTPPSSEAAKSGAGAASQDNVAAEFVLTASTPVGEDSVNHYITYKAKELIEERSGGRIQINIYENGQLGGDREVLEGLIAGSIAFDTLNTSAFVPFVPDSGVFDLPHLYPDIETARRALDGPILESMAPKFDAAGFKLFGFSDSGFRELTTNRKIETIDDFKGLKIRTMENPYHLSYWMKLGANPTPMDFGEVYIGLQQGTIDGQENPYDLIVANKIYETQKYIVETDHLLQHLMMVMSKQVYDSMPPDLQQTVEQSLVEAMQYGREKADERIESRKKIVTDYGCEIITLSPELKAQIMEQVRGVYDEVGKNVSSGLVDFFVDEVDKARGQAS